MNTENYIFKGRWITTDEFATIRPLNVFHRQMESIELDPKLPVDSHVLFRKRFELKSTENTYIRISVDDYYKLYINGRFVCMGPAPGYNFHYYYNKVDISEYVCAGENVIAVHTYYQGLINRVWVSGDDRHGLILDITQDGKTVLSSDESFLYSYHNGFENIGLYGLNTQFAQRYISGTEQEGFERPGYDDSGWRSARTKVYTDYELYEQPTKMLDYETVEPKLIFDENGVTADFGAVYAGYLNAEVKGGSGDCVELLFGQELDDDGNVRWKLRAGCDYREEWILSGKDDVLNEFDFKSFRYVRINMPSGCRINKLNMLIRHYPFVLKAKPSVTDPELLKIWDLCTDTLKYGTQEVIQDCMEREKGNYLGDGCYTSLAYAVLTGDAALLKKLIDDSLRSSFIDKGLVTCACCSHIQEIAEYPLMMYYSLYEYYKFSGDRDYLESVYDGLCDVLDRYLVGYLTDRGLLCVPDKWCVGEWPAQYRDGYVAELKEGVLCYDVHNVINAHFIGAMIYMNKIADVLGYPPYCDVEPFKDAFYNEFYDSEKKLFRDMADNSHISMISNVFPFMYGIYREKETEEAIVRLIEQKGITSVMLFGAFPILAGLKRIGNTELMYKLMKDKGAWLNMLSEGATRTFEGWSKSAKKNASLFHLVLTYAVLFLTNWEK